MTVLCELSVCPSKARAPVPSDVHVRQSSIVCRCHAEANDEIPDEPRPRDPKAVDSVS